MCLEVGLIGFLLETMEEERDIGVKDVLGIVVRWRLG